MKDLSGTFTSSEQIIAALSNQRSDDYAKGVLSFFKTGKGGYAEQDVFWGVKVPDVREIVKRVAVNPAHFVVSDSCHMSSCEVKKLLMHPVHEVRLCGFLILVSLFSSCFRGGRVVHDTAVQDVLECYIENIDFANNWDLVDLSAPGIMGMWLLHGRETMQEKKKRLDKLALSDSLWQQRVSIVSWLTPVRKNTLIDEALHYCSLNIAHPHDLIHKAIGWVLREVGKKNGCELRAFLSANGKVMSRTTLRYAIEKMEIEERKQWLHKKF